jgi:hypothetical protein
VAGTNTLYVRFAGPPDATLAYAGASGQGFAVAADSFTYVSLPQDPGGSLSFQTSIVVAGTTLFKVFYASTAGRTQIAQLTDWRDIYANPTYDNGIYITYNIFPPSELPVGLLYFYIAAISDADGSSIVGGVYGNPTPVTIPNYQPPTSFTWAAGAGNVDITRSTGSTSPIPTDIYFGPAGATSVASLTYSCSEWLPIDNATTFYASMESGLENGRTRTRLTWSASLRIYILCAGVLLSNSSPLIR